MNGYAPFRQVALGSYNPTTNVYTGVTVDETPSIPFDCTGYRYLVLYFYGVGTLDSGVLTVEEADYDKTKEPIYGGTWSSITTINATSLTGGVQIAYHFTVANYAFVRVRVSTTIAGSNGSVYAVLRGE